ncbi:MAG TPA: S8 family serine peptidase [Syntrophorhabdaceae bacterium]|jgi:subtilisin family serine protease
MIKKLHFWKEMAMACAVAIAVLSVLPGAGYALTVDNLQKKVVSPGGYDALLSRAQELGRVKVLVRVATEYAPEKSLSPAAVQSQRSAIRTAQDRVIADLSGRGLKPTQTHKYTYVPYLAMDVDRATLDTLLASGSVADVQEDIPVPPTADPGWDITLMGANSLHTAGVKGSGITVAVLDTGVDKNHPYLSGAVVSEACYSTTNGTYGSTSLCPGGASESTALGSALPYGTNCPAGECDHGTHVAGTIAGRESIAGSPGPGVAPAANIIAIQVFSLFPGTYSSCNGTPCVLSYTSDQIKGLERVYALRSTYTVASSNMSLGGGQFTSNCDNDSRKPIIDSLKAAGIATVIASGNSYYCGSMGAPGCISSAVSVGATDSGDAVAAYSNSVSFLNLFAPGSGITSSIPNSGWGTWNGTSMATPHVAGAWALMKSKSSALTVDQILAAFTSTGTSVTDTGKCPDVTKKRINVYQAYSSLGDTFTLTVTKPGPGAGTVSSSPSGIDCGSTCAGGFAPGTAVTLTPTAASGSAFAYWTGACSGALPACTATMTADTSVAAVFYPTNNKKFRLGVTKRRTSAGDGTVTSSDTMINCGSTCAKNYYPGAPVTLTAVATGNAVFTGWSGPCSGTGTCSVTMDAAKPVTANFAGPQKLTVTKRKVNRGDGTVTSAPAGIDCGTTCQYAFTVNTSVTLTAVPAAGSIFTGWSGSAGCTGTGTCTVTMDKVKTAIASFTGPYNLRVVKVSRKAGTGTVTSAPAGIDCGTTCVNTFTANSSVTLTAAASGTSTFTNWAGSCTGTATTCTLTMDKVRTTQAIFTGP